MLRSHTVFIIGAGVSKELGLPLGAQLKHLIRDALPDDEGGGADALRDQLFALDSPTDVSRAIRDLRAALLVGPSIDTVVEHRSFDPLLVHIAKTAILYCILEGERSSTIFNDEFEDLPAEDGGHDTTYGELFRLIVGSCDSEHLEDALGRVSIVNFNYDRCLEHYFVGALVNYSGLSISRAEQLVSGLSTWHPYGVVAPLHGVHRQPDAVRFGASPKRQNLTTLAKFIKTFSEERASNEDETIKSALAEASQVIFLGCALHPQNLRLISPATSWYRSAYGTCYMPPPSDPDGFAAPSMLEYAVPTINQFTDAVSAWRAPSDAAISRRIEFEPLTARQLMSKYAPAWRA